MYIVTEFVNSNFIVSDIPGAFQGQRSGVTPPPTFTTVHSFLQLVLLLCTLAMLMSLEVELTSLSEETPLSPQSLQQGPFLGKLTSLVPSSRPSFPSHAVPYCK